jgi:quercetin dioxygenase-like cupin family protein
MEGLARRSALALGLAAAAAPTLVPSRAAMAQMHGPDEGREVAPGVRRVDLGQRESMIQGYKTVSMRDVVYQPGASTSNPTMNNDMVCHIVEGELTLNQGEGREFTAKKGDVWTCATGSPEAAKNTGNVVAIMRDTDLLSA